MTVKMNLKDLFYRMYQWKGYFLQTVQIQWEQTKIRESASVMALNMARLMIIQYEMEN